MGVEDKILFEPIAHTYTNSITKRLYRSVTTVIGDYEQEFDEMGISKAISLQPNDRRKEMYKGLTQDEILFLWKEENRIANEYGTKIHDLLEKYLKANLFYFPTDDWEREILNAYDELNIDLGVKYYCEKILHNDNYEIAGMTDHLVDLDDNFFDVNDYKTNKVINFYSPYQNRLKYPLDFLDDCQFNVYALQLSMYAYFYEQETGKKCRSLKLLYYDREIKKFIPYYTPYMKMEVIAMLEHYKKNNLN